MHSVNKNFYTFLRCCIHAHNYDFQVIPLHADHGRHIAIVHRASKRFISMEKLAEITPAVIYCWCCLLYLVCSSIHLQSRLIPTAKHFRKRQYWHRLRFNLMTKHLPSRKHRYSICFCMLRRKKPCQKSNHRKNRIVKSDVIWQHEVKSVILIAGNRW